MEIAIVAGEVSGDLQATRLVRELRKKIPGVKVWGIGGGRLSKEGVEIVYDITKWAVIGFWEVLKNYSKIRKIFYGFLSLLSERKPDALILIDYPGFNLRLAKKVKQLKIPVIYYISPQVWAWGRKRVVDIKNTVQKMIVIFPFEKEFYEKNGVPVEFVGHPIVDILTSRNYAGTSFREQVGVKNKENLVGILPGSREQEIRRHLPVLLEVVRGMSDTKFVIGAASSEIFDIIKEYSGSVPVYCDRTYDIMESSDVVITSSGTATLETACFGTPMVVVYKLNRITFFFIRAMIDIKNIAMVNVVAGDKIVPELIQDDVTSENIIREVKDILDNPDIKEKMQADLEKVKEKLGSPGAVRRAAETVCGVLGVPKGTS